MSENWFKILLASARAAGLAAFCCILPVASAADGNSAQQQAAEEYLAALAAGDARQMAFAIHKDELEQLRSRLLDEMHLEADRGETMVRSRLFGSAMPLDEIERLTPQTFFVTLAQRLRFSGREFERVDWIGAVSDSGGMVQMVGRLRPSKDQGTVRVPVVVSIVPWGKDWKAALPLELQAQIDDLRTGRTRPAPTIVASVAAAATPGTVAGSAPAASASPQAILELFDAARVNLEAARCEEYYDKQMSPNFRRTTGTKALRTLVSACENREALRQQLLSALQLARAATPRFEYAGTRATYDLRGKGLPYPELIVEQVDKRWYIAE